MNAFKERKVKDEMGGLAAEKLFRPLTRRMGEKQIQQLAAPDYDVDDEIRNWDEFPFEGDEDEEEDSDYSLLEEGPDYSLLEEDHKKDETLLFLAADGFVFVGRLRPALLFLFLKMSPILSPVFFTATSLALLMPFSATFFPASLRIPTTRFFKFLPILNRESVMAPVPLCLKTNFPLLG